MQTKTQRIIILGAGFAGLSLARKLSSSGLNLDILLVDKKDVSDFLPLLPDLIGRNLHPDYLSINLEQFCRKIKCKFLLADCLGVDLTRKEVRLSRGIFAYDYLVMASGSETNFYGNEVIKNCAHTLDSVADARKIIQALKQRSYDNYIVCGGGYTGVEAATNLQVFLIKNKINKRVIIIERAPKILSMVPEWMQAYVKLNLNQLGIEIFTDSVIEKAENSSVYLNNNRSFPNAFLIWVAGVKTAAYIQDLQVEKNAQGRIKTDDFLRLNDSCFVAGDAAYFNAGGNYLRMAIQFAITQGDQAADNLIRSIKGKQLVQFKPRDLGYIIPLANNKACGQIMGFDFKGFFPLLLHYSMCIYRSYGLRSKSGILRNLLSGGVK
jgi:NADH dehydrogenase